MTDELKPVRCGCGGEAKIISSVVADRKSYMVYCEKCRILTNGHYSEAEAVTAWNRAMSGVAKDINVPNKKAKVAFSFLNNYHFCDKCGFVVCPNCDVYCAGCGAKLDWSGNESC